MSRFSLPLLPLRMSTNEWVPSNAEPLPVMDGWDESRTASAFRHVIYDGMVTQNLTTLLETATRVARRCLVDGTAFEKKDWKWRDRLTVTPEGTPFNRDTIEYVFELQVNYIGDFDPHVYEHPKFNYRYFACEISMQARLLSGYLGTPFATPFQSVTVYWTREDVETDGSAIFLTLALDGNGNPFLGPAGERIWMDPMDEDVAAFPFSERTQSTIEELPVGVLADYEGAIRGIKDKIRESDEPIFSPEATASGTSFVPSQNINVHWAPGPHGEPKNYLFRGASWHPHKPPTDPL